MGTRTNTAPGRPTALSRWSARMKSLSAAAVALIVALVVAGIVFLAERDSLDQTYPAEVRACVKVINLAQNEYQFDSALYTVLSNTGRQPISILGFRAAAAGDESLEFDWIPLDEAEAAPTSNSGIYLEPGKAAVVAIYYPSNYQNADIRLERSDGQIETVPGTFAEKVTWPRAIDEAFEKFETPCDRLYPESDTTPQAAQAGG